MQLFGGSDETAELVQFQDGFLAFDRYVFVMAGLVPAIHVYIPRGQDVDARDEPGHDVGRERAPDYIIFLYKAARINRKGRLA